MSATLDEADVVVVGTGAGGATVARALARAGIEPLMLEEGPDLRERPTEPDALAAMTSRFRDFGAQVAHGPSMIPIIQGRMVGGSTAINSAIFWRLPEAIHAEWTATDPALRTELSYNAIAAATASIEEAISVRPVEREVMGRNNLLLERATQALGIAGKVIRRAESGCEGRGRCILGCPNRRRSGMESTFVPEVLERGGRLRAGARVVKVRIERGRATGVEVETREGRRFVRGRRGVVLAAGAIHTPWLLLESGLRRNVGERFTMHPGFSVGGVFDERVGLEEGATQGFESTHLGARGMKVEALGLPKALAAARLPGSGPAFRELAERLDHLAVWGCLVRPGRHGRVTRSLFGGPRIESPFDEEDLERALVGVKHLVSLMFAAGAQKVLPGIAGAPAVIESASELDGLTRLLATQLSMVATHLFGGAVLGTDPARSVVSPRFAVHGTEGLFVGDASVIPTSLGVNPQGTIMALAALAGERIAESLEA